MQRSMETPFFAFTFGDNDGGQGLPFPLKPRPVEKAAQCTAVLLEADGDHINLTYFPR